MITVRVVLAFACAAGYYGQPSLPIPPLVFKEHDRLHGHVVCQLAALRRVYRTQPDL